MTRKAMNVIIGIVIAFIVVFFAGSFAYEQYLIRLSDAEYNQKTDDELSKEYDDNKSGSTNDEDRN